jgi:hypothetical protein
MIFSLLTSAQSDMHDSVQCILADVVHGNDRNTTSGLTIALRLTSVRNESDVYVDEGEYPADITYRKIITKLLDDDAMPVS